MFVWNVNGGKPIVIHMGTMEIQVAHDLWVGDFPPDPECMHKGDD
jgi:hypothetical protein